MKYTQKMIITCFLAITSLASAQDGKKVVAFAQDTLKNDFRLAQVAEVRNEAAKVPGLSFVHSDAQGKTALLIRQIEEFTERKVDVLVVGTNDESAVVPAVRKAYKAGIPVIVLDRGIKGNDFTTFINSDNIKIGAMGGEFIAQKLNGTGLVLLFEGLQSADVTKLRTQGFMSVMVNYPNIKVIKRTGNYLRKDALQEMEKLIKSGVHVDAIFAESDSMLSGARMAMAQHKIDAHKVISVGCDYTSEAREAIRDGTQTGSVLFPLGGKMTIEVAQKLLAKQPVPRHVQIPVKLITRDNVEQEAPIF
jgi:ribose transport system substrate-binding protein